ncbi:hypothetical protein GPJ56_004663 [Histomonas meleagridis]|uniref:uncharacterized protein n=1 Tax=Histomonas meleagridis TaxID=135588 RepID=UPI003559B19F|nr:hypothetical protein GPJ56_004663 [Histomonas meleagridis]KAH0797424.1 hypothetical protein GO595_009745 [Histomonas meleagridis]
MLPPYNVDLNSEEDLVICLLTGNILSMSKNGKYQYVMDYLREYFNNTFLLIMDLNGNDATMPAIIMKNIKTKLNVFYRDEFGDIDVGFEKGDLTLKLSQEWIEKLIDMLLSSAWVDLPTSAVIGDFMDFMQTMFRFV